jgi:hypothetical protein
MKRLLVLFAVLGLLAFSASMASAQYLIGGPATGGDPAGSTSHNNGNLDLTHATEVVPGFFLPKPNVWVYSGTRTISGPYQDGLSSEPWAGPVPTPDTTDGNLNPPSPDGCGGPDCAVFFKAFSGNATDGAANVDLSQTHPATAGFLYTLTGWAGAEANFLATDAQFAVRFLDGASADIGGTTLSLPANGLFAANGEAFNYKQFSVGAVAPAGTVSVVGRISMVGGLNNPAGGGQAFVVDDFTLVGTPEPATAVLCCLGAVGLFGFARRR